MSCWPVRSDNEHRLSGEALMAKKTAAPKIVATKSEGSVGLGLSQPASERAIMARPAANAGSMMPGVVGERPVPGDAPANFAELGRPDERDPGAGRRARRGCVAAMSGAMETREQASREASAPAAPMRPASRRSRRSRPAAVAYSPRPSKPAPIAGIDGNHKSRDGERKCACCHDPNDVELQLSSACPSVPDSLGL